MIYQLSSDGTEYALISYADVDEIVDPTILSEINGIPVKSVRLNAFLGFQNVTGTLTIPASIEKNRIFGFCLYRHRICYFRRRKSYYASRDKHFQRMSVPRECDFA